MARILCFDSLLLEDCINSLWDLGVKDDILCLIYLMNFKATVTIKTPRGDTDPLFPFNLCQARNSCWACTQQLLFK